MKARFAVLSRKLTRGLLAPGFMVPALVLAGVGLVGVAPVGVEVAQARTFKAQVSRFQRLTKIGGETFVIKPMTDPSLASTLEFQTYSQNVAAQLVALGYTQSTTPETAALIVTIDYGVDQGREKLRGDWSSWGVGGGWGWGGGGWGWGGRWGPGWGAGDSFGDVETYTVYGSKFDMNITRADDGTQLFQGRARAHTRKNEETVLVPDLIQAMFSGFPGVSGETVKVKIKTQKKKS